MAGIQDPDVVDLVTHDPRSDEYALIMVQTEPWRPGREQVEQVLRKIDTYMIFTRSGGLAASFPEAADRPFRLQLDCQTAPPTETSQLLDVAAERLRRNGVTFVVNVLA